MIGVRDGGPRAWPTLLDTNRGLAYAPLYEGSDRRDG